MSDGQIIDSHGGSTGHEAIPDDAQQLRLPPLTREQVATDPGTAPPEPPHVLTVHRLDDVHGFVMENLAAAGVVSQTELAIDRARRATAERAGRDFHDPFSKVDVPAARGGDRGDAAEG